MQKSYDLMNDYIFAKWFKAVEQLIIWQKGPCFYCCSPNINFVLRIWNSHNDLKALNINLKALISTIFKFMSGAENMLPTLLQKRGWIISYLKFILIQQKRNVGRDLLEIRKSTGISARNFNSFWFPMFSAFQPAYNAPPLIYWNFYWKVLNT